MAFSFDEVNDYVSLADNAALTLPSGDWFIGGRVKLDNNTGTQNQYLLSWGLSETPSLIVFIGEASRSSVFPHEVVANFIDDNGLSSGFPSTDDNQPFSANTDWTYVGVGRDSDDLKIVIDGTVQTTFDLSSIGTFIGANSSKAIKFGARDDLDSNQYLGGDMAEWAKWDSFPSAGELTALSKGFSPAFFKNNLKWYVPMIRDYVETIGSITVTNTGSAVSVHPPTIYPTGASIGYPSVDHEAVINDALTFGGTGVLHTAHEAVINDALVFGGTGVFNRDHEAVINDALVFSGTGAFSRAHEAVINDALLFGGTGALNTAYQGVINDTLVFGGSGILGRGWTAVINDALVFGGSGVLEKMWNSTDTASALTWSNTDASTSLTWGDTD